MGPTQKKSRIIWSEEQPYSYLYLVMITNITRLQHLPPVHSARVLVSVD